MYALSVHEAIKILYSYPTDMNCEVRQLSDVFCWLFLYIHGSVAFPEMLPIDMENPYRLSKRSVSIGLLS